jgi:hypothetical protein
VKIGLVRFFENQTVEIKKFKILGEKVKKTSVIKKNCGEKNVMKIMSIAWIKIQN